MQAPLGCLLTHRDGLCAVHNLLLPFTLLPTDAQRPSISSAEEQFKLLLGLRCEFEFFTRRRRSRGECCALQL